MGEDSLGRGVPRSQGQRSTRVVKPRPSALLEVNRRQMLSMGSLPLGALCEQCRHWKQDRAPSAQPLPLTANILGQNSHSFTGLTALEKQGVNVRNPPSSPVSYPPPLAAWSLKSPFNRSKRLLGRVTDFTQNACQLLAVCLMNHGLSWPHIHLLIVWLTPDNTGVTHRRHPHDLFIKKTAHTMTNYK